MTSRPQQVLNSEAPAYLQSTESAQEQKMFKNTKGANSKPSRHTTKTKPTAADGNRNTHDKKRKKVMLGNEWDPPSIGNAVTTANSEMSIHNYDPVVDATLETLKIDEEPEATSRFRYKSEKSLSPLLGERSKPKAPKSYASLQLKGYVAENYKNVEVLAFCVTNETYPRIHPNQLEDTKRVGI